jgi:tripartite-type tricarboxylate transporter receptor subunit TctC
VPIALMASQSLMLVVAPDFPAKTLDDLLAQARAKPGQLRYASFGTGSTSHLAMELLEQRAKVDMIHVPYKGGGPALTDVMGGHVEMMFSGFPTAIPQVRAGKVRAIAVSSPKRSSIAPEIPTVAELGFPGFATEAWYGLSAPAGTPPAIVEKVRSAVNAALAKPEVRDLLLSRSVEIINVGPVEFAAFNKAEVEKWANTLRTLNLKLE